jgi:hypothetical protein
VERVMETIIYTPDKGEHIVSAVKEMALVANANNAIVTMQFNEETVTVWPEDDLNEVIAAYQEKINKKSPEQEAYREVILERKYAQRETLLTLCKEKPDFNSLESCINWFVEVGKLDLISISHLPIAELFEKHGYLPNVYINDEFNPEDKEIFGRWLIGQALHCIQKAGTIYPMFSKHAEYWKKKFCTKA